MGLLKKDKDVTRLYADMQAANEEKIDKNKTFTFEEVTKYMEDQQRTKLKRLLEALGFIMLIGLVLLAVGSFLYPYSIFNMFGDNDRFWDCWSHIQYHMPIQDLIILNGGDDFDSTFSTVHDIYDDGGWMTIKDILRIAFTQGTSFKLNFLVLGSWSIIIVSTIGLIGLILGFIYVVAYEIGNFIIFTRSLNQKVNEVLHGVGTVAKTSIDEANAEQNKDAKSTVVVEKKQQAPRKKKEEVKKEEKVVISTEDAELEKKLAAMKKEIAEENVINDNAATTNTVVEKPQSGVVYFNAEEHKDLNNKSDDELDKLLRLGRKQQ